jgi:hypothetical protein
MKRNVRHVQRTSIALVIMGALAVCGIALTWGTARNYLGASTAAARFQSSVQGVTCSETNSEYKIRIDVSLTNGSEWDLSVTSMRSIVYLDGQYVWGHNYDWTGNPLDLPRGSVNDIILEIEVPPTKTDVVATGGDVWSIRVSGLLDMPRLGTKLFVTKAQIPLERGNG